MLKYAHHTKTEELLHRVAELKSHNLELFIEEHEEIMAWVAGHNLVAEELARLLHGEDATEFSPVLSVVPELTDDFDEVFITDTEGHIVASTNEASVGMHINLAYLQDTQTVSKIVYAEHLEKNVVYLPFVIIHDDTGSTVGFTVAAVSLAEITEVIEVGSTIGTTGETYLVSREGLLLTPARFITGGGGVLSQRIDTVGERCNGDRRLSEETRAGRLSLEADYRGEQVLAAHAPVPGTTWCIHTKIDTEEAADMPLRREMTRMMIITAVIIFLSGTVGYIIGRRFERTRAT